MWLVEVNHLPKNSTSFQKWRSRFRYFLAMAFKPFGGPSNASALLPKSFGGLSNASALLPKPFGGLSNAFALLPKPFGSPFKQFLSRSKGFGWHENRFANGPFWGQKRPVCETIRKTTSAACRRDWFERPQ